MIDSKGRTALWWASANGHLFCARALVGEKANVNLCECEFHTSPLIAATKANELSIVQVLLQAGAKVDSTDDEGRSALSIACEAGYCSIVETLIANRGRTNQRDKEGRTPAAYAALNGHVEVVFAMIHLGRADLGISDSIGATPLMLAAGKAHVKVVELLLDQHSVEVDARDDDGKTALMYAAATGSMEVCFELLKHARGLKAKSSAVHISTGDNTDLAGLNPHLQKSVDLALGRVEMKMKKDVQNLDKSKEYLDAIEVRC